MQAFVNTCHEFLKGEKLRKEKIHVKYIISNLINLTHFIADDTDDHPGTKSLLASILLSYLASLNISSKLKEIHASQGGTKTSKKKILKELCELFKQIL